MMCVYDLVLLCKDRIALGSGLVKRMWWFAELRYRVIATDFAHCWLIAMLCRLAVFRRGMAEVVAIAVVN